MPARKRPNDPTRVALFAKAPRPGHAKTRLGRDIGDEAAANLYAAFLGDVVERVGAAPDLDLVVWAASPDDVGELETLGAPVEVQPDADLGARMQAAMHASLQARSRVIVIGSDAPTLPLSSLRAARRALDVGEAELVLGPTVDGGYALVGGREAFDFGPTIRWSSQHALADTLARAAELGKRTARVRPLYDIDTAADLRLLRLELALDPKRAPRTAAALQRMRPF